MPELLEEVTAWLGYEDQSVPASVWIAVLLSSESPVRFSGPPTPRPPQLQLRARTPALWVIGLTCGTGQMVTFGLANIFGGTLMERWTWVSNKAHATKEKLGERLDQSYLSLSFLASLIGIPPLWAMVLLGDSFQVNRRKLLTICLAGRIIRFSVLGFLGNQAASFFA